MNKEDKSFKAKEAAIEVWGATPAGTTFGKGCMPGTKDFFENVLMKRSTYEQPWLFEIIPFSTYREKKILEIGCGAGYDAYEFCRNGVDYTGIDIAPENIDRTRKHLSFYGYQPKLRVGDAEYLEFGDESFDVVFSNGVFHHLPDMPSALKEVYRVLRPGGSFYVIVYNKNSIFYWGTLFLVDYLMRLRFLKYSFKERLSMVEYTTAKAHPLVCVYSRKEVKKLLMQSGFSQVEQLCIRKLVKEDLPCFRFLGILWKWIPQSFLDKLGKFVGWYIIAKVRKE